jgi:hypothetical protein
VLYVHKFIANNLSFKRHLLTYAKRHCQILFSRNICSHENILSCRKFSVRFNPPHRQAALRRENIALRDVFPNVRLGFADRREIIVASARRSPNSRFGRIFFRNKFPRKQPPSRALRYSQLYNDKQYMKT